MDKALKAINQALEHALRSAIVLNNYDHPISMERLIATDYISLHTRDVGGPPSLHPNTPHRPVQVLVKNEVMKQALHYLISKELAAVKFSTDGIRYCKTELTELFVANLESEYAKKLADKVRWTIEFLSTMDDESLSSYLKGTLMNWKAEFVTVQNRIEETHE